MFLHFTRRIKPISFMRTKKSPYPLIVEDTLINPLQISHITVCKTRVCVYVVGEKCYSKEEATPSLAQAEFERIEREMKFSLSRILKDTQPNSKEKKISWDMPSPDTLAMEQLK